MNVKQWLKLAIDVLEFAIERIPTVPGQTEDDTPPDQREPVEVLITERTPDGSTKSGVAAVTIPSGSGPISTQEKIPPMVPSGSGPKVILDAEGIPWDGRIHGSGKTFLAKTGCWKLKRGVDPVLVAKIKTELTIAQGAPTGAVPPPVLNGGGTAVPPAPAETVTTWAQLMDKIAADGTHPDTVLAACNKFNVANIGILQDTPVLVPLIATELGF